MSSRFCTVTIPQSFGTGLGSTSVTTNASGQCTSAQWYYTYGNIRTPAPTTPCSGTLPTDFGFTGQRRDASADLMFYNARYYDSALGRFISADTLVPSAGNPQALNRYAYAYNNPLRYNDPTGHDAPDIINFLDEFSTGAAFEAWTNIAWFIPGHENLQVKAGESDVMTAGRVLGDVIALGIGVDEMIGGSTIFGGGVATCGTVVLCWAGAPAMAVGATVAGSGAWTTGNAIANGANNLNNLTSRARANKPISAIDPPTWRGGLRGAMEKAKIGPPVGMRNPQVHHNLPWTFREWFAGRFRGMNVNDSQFGRWVSGSPDGPHQAWTWTYEQEWRQFIGRNPDATREQVLDFLKDLLNSGRFPSQ